MTVTSTWQIEFLDATTTTDLTTEVLGFTITQNLQVGSMARYGGFIDLNNIGNLFTPSGGGTYENFAWFNKIVRITCDIHDGSSTSTANVFHGVVSDINFQDNGSNAKVTVTLADFYSYAGRDAVTAIDTSAAYGELDQIAQDILNGSGTASGVDAVPFPKFGATNATVTNFDKLNNVDPAETATYPIGFSGIVQEFDSGTGLDYVNSQIMPSGPALCYPTTASYDSGTAKWTLNAAYINRLLNKETVSSTDHFRTFEFTGTKTADKFPVRTVSTQYNTVNTINQAQIQSAFPASGSGPTFINNTTSQDNVGIRSVTFNKVVPVVFGGATDTQKTKIGEFWPNRYGTVKFTAQTATLTTAAIDALIDSSSRQTYADFLDVQTGLFSHAKVTFTPTGASSATTYQSVITGRTINATPTSTEITLRLATADDNQSFKLNSSDIGVLDTNRVG